METSKRKKNILFTTIMSVLGLIGAMAMQLIWISNSYQLVRNDLQKVGYTTIEKALKEEGNMRFLQLPEGTRISSGQINDTIPQMTYLYEGLSDMGYNLSLNNLDSIVSKLLIQEGLGNQYYIYLVNKRTGEILDSIGTQKETSFMTVKPKCFPIRSDYTEVIQLVITNPYKTYAKRMGLLFIGTFIIMMVVIICIVHLVKFISRFEKILLIREDFSYAMIHDMKTPLTSIIMALKFLRSGKLDDKLGMKSNYFDIAENEAEHLLSLTNKVLTISKLENYKLEMNKCDVLIVPMLEKLLEKFNIKSQKHIDFTVDIKTDTVYADAEYLEEAISNLIDNSIKYSNDSVEINISTSYNDKYSIIKIHDNGIGIAEKDIHRIFQKFERTSAMNRNRKKEISGFGLGLNFVEQVVKAHEGKIFVTSIEGEFTEFDIYLPLKQIIEHEQ